MGSNPAGRTNLYPDTSSSSSLALSGGAESPILTSVAETGSFCRDRWGYLLGLLHKGIYETLITEGLNSKLAELGERYEAKRESLHPAEAADRIALHLSRSIEREIRSRSEKNRVALGIRVARDLLLRLDELVENADSRSELPIETGEMLHAVLGRAIDGSIAALETPKTPLLDTTILTNSPGEPRIGTQIRSEIPSSDRIDLLMAFIRRSGLAPVHGELRRHCESGRPLRVLTTTYTNSTESRALDLLRDLGADVRVSYDTSTTRLHAKSWIFHRKSGYSTAYIGSSNLTHSAQVSGLEWNVRLSGVRNPDGIDKIAAVFDSYWESGDFAPYEREEFERRCAAQSSSRPSVILSPLELRPYPFQERLLEQIELSRRQGYHRNLLAAATGTGKTVMAAVDYLRLRKILPRARLLFVAHRKEILDQSRAVFCQALRDESFGERWVDGARPTRFEHVFASIQSLNTIDLENLAPDHFDVVIIDEFHHAAAPSYRRLIDHLRPQELLGLTATPERADGLPVLQWFDERIAAELRLWDAIEQHRLTPFLYYGVHDGVDLSQVSWKRGRGYDADELSELFVTSDSRSNLILKHLVECAESVDRMRALGFCVSVQHARYMADFFNAKGIASVAVSGEIPRDERARALGDLRDGRIQVIFSVDLFNEGVDVPAVDTLLFLRPTDSPVLFLQQLGRGLRLAEGKAACSVLDFVGHHHKEFRFDRRLRALLGGTRRDVEQQVREGFPYLPAGCHMELDPVASDIVLKNIRESLPSRWNQKVDELRALVASARPPRLAEYLEHSGLELDDVYSSGNRGWSDLCDDAGVATEPSGPHEAIFRRAIGRLLHVDDEVRLQAWGKLVRMQNAPKVASMPERERRLVRMLVAPMVGEVKSMKGASLQVGVDLLWQHPQVLHELAELCGVLGGSIDHLTKPLTGRESVPLQIHARYTRIEILAAFGDAGGDRAKVAAWQTGVRWLPESKADLFAFTLDKSDGHFSPTTRYRDYAITRELIHWESQSITREDHETGRRYQNHAREGSDVMLFARLRQSERAFWFLGPATYVEHTGERPMAITWRLHTPLPGDLFAAFKAVA